MQLSQIRDEVELIIQDAGYTPTQIDSYINQAMLRVCDLVAIPSLKVVDTVDTIPGQRYSPLASVTGGFSGRLRKVINSDKEQVKAFPDLESLIVSYPEIVTGAVEYCALEGITLWYHPSPEEAETLLIVYYKNPTELVDDTDTPDIFPSSLHRNLLVHGACFIIFDQIEDGVEGQKVNTLSHYYHSLNDKPGVGVKSGIQELREYIAGRRHNYSGSVWRV